jgi:uncharacterized protein YbjT (DUF2867 family)
MSTKHIIAVVGATGAQGGGLVRAILEDGSGRFAARALTRQPDSDRARALAAEGAEVVEADLDEPASLAAAFDGAWGAFCLTNFWEHFSPERELAQARNQAGAAQAAGLQHVIWSTLEDTRRRVPLDDPRMPNLMERYKVPHFDAKGEADAFFRESGLPVSFLLTSFYWDNLIHFGSGPTRDADGRLALTLPMGQSKLPGIAAADIGRCALGVFRSGAHYRGRYVGIAGEHLTGSAMAQALSEALGEPVRYDAVSPATYRGLGFPGAEDLGNMFQYKQEFEAEFCGARSVAESRALNPRLQSFRQWLAQHAAEIPLNPA